MSASKQHARIRVRRWPAGLCSLMIILHGPARAGGALDADWPRASMQETAPVADVLAELDAAFASGDYGYIDEFLLIKDRKVFAHFRYRPDYRKVFDSLETAVLPTGPWYGDKDSFPYNYIHPDWHPWYLGTDLHTLQSVTKSIVSVVTGIAIDRGDIAGVGVGVVDLLASRYRMPHRDSRLEAATLHDLLAMRLNLAWPSDLPFASPDNPDTGIELSDDWAQYVFGFPMAAPPGTSFQYNSGATQLIGAMLREATGVEIAEYARRHLFRKLGIERFYWKQTPSGASDALGGLYLRATDLAKIGQLFLDDGRWNGASVVSRDWVRKSLAPITADAGDGFAYGYQWWLPVDDFGGGAFAGLGFGGQMLLGLPEQDLVVVLYAWNPDHVYPKPKQSAQAMLMRRLKADIIPRLAK